MPAKFKPSERIINRVRGQRMNTASAKNKKFKHYWLKNTSKDELFTAINSPRTKPKHRIKFINELVRRGININFMTQEEYDAKQ
jgi:hypothetical protein|tara:strand:- start:107 stop:358 length:252 start_codon:yes stop_codon:yes gene_type:complete